jgi:TRAP transporter 4TM/12TM fusion protein
MVEEKHIADLEALTRLPARYRALTGAFKYCAVVLTLLGVAIATYQIMHWDWFFGIRMWPRTYYCLMILCFAPVAVLMIPHRAGVKKVPWFDYLFIALIMGIAVYFAIHTVDIEWRGWEVEAPLLGTISSVIFCLLMLELARRGAGPIFFGVCAFFFVYLIFAGHFPGFLMGKSLPFLRACRGLAFGTSGFFGLPMKVVADMLMGFYFYGVTLLWTGGGKFFLDLAYSVLGGTRGGPAKASVIGSMFFGSLSGSVVANVVTTGSFTIPAMKRMGFSPEYAGAVETCASTGGVLMPPVMGAVAFIMAVILSVPYSVIIVAALVPSLLYYFTLFMQVDAHAAVRGIKGLPKEELPSIWPTLKGGWPYLLSVVVLVFGLLVMRWAEPTPYYATFLLLIITQARKKTRLNREQWIDFVLAAGRLIGEVTAIILGVGFILGAMLLTGVSYSLSKELIDLTGGNPYLMLLAAAITCFVLGMAETSTAAYIFLSVMIGPPLVKLGFDLIAVNLFLIYYAMTSYITPPVCIGAFAAAGIAGADPLKTGLAATKMAVLILVIPFMFVVQPALILRGPITDILLYVLTCAAGLVFLAAAFEGYLVGIGKVNLWMRVVCLIIGICLGLLPWVIPKIVGGALVIILILVYLWRRHRLSREKKGVLAIQ